jgi:hypothetical protein
MYTDLVKLLDAVYPGLFHKCPYEGVISPFCLVNIFIISMKLDKFLQTISIYNATLTLPKEKMSLFTFQPLPNGIYKTSVKMYDDKDDNILQGATYFEKNVHFNVWDL